MIAGLGSLVVRLQYSKCLASHLYLPGFEPETLGGHLSWISCKYILRLISCADTERSPVSSVNQWLVLTTDSLIWTVGVTHLPGMTFCSWSWHARSLCWAKHRI